MPDIVTQIFSHPWSLWILLALVCAIVEILTPSFFFIFVSIGALAAALTAIWGGMAVQLAVGSVVLVLSALLLRPMLVERLQAADKIPSRTQALLSKSGLVTEAIDPVTKSGRVTVEGQDWAAEASHPIAVGKTIEVKGADGIVLIVKESHKEN